MTSILRPGGWAGVLGSALMLGAFVLVGALGLPDPSSPESLLRYTGISTARIVENALYLAALVLMAMHVAALSRTLRRTSPAAALFGGTAGLLGSGLLIAGALIHLGTAPFARLHREAPPEQRETIVLAWQGVQAVFDTLLVTGALVVAAGLVLLAMALRRSPSFGPVVGGISLVIGAAAVVGAATAVAVPGSPAVAVAVLGLVAFHAVVGAKALREAR